MIEQRKAARGAWVRAAAAVSLAVSLASCGVEEANKEMSNMTLEEAKTKLLTLQHQIIEMVPEELVVSVFENDSSGLLNCRGDKKKWTGTGQVELQPGLDRDKFLDQVRDRTKDIQGWTVKDDSDSDGARTVDILHDDGTHLIVGIWDGPESLQIDSFSACFDFPEYEYGEKY